jgi:hypothetical protein
MTFADKVLSFNHSLQLNSFNLPTDVEVMNPFTEPEVQRITQQFYQKYYADRQKRFIILGINPGRHGAGTTGIPFTDPHKLIDHCGIHTEDISTAELSAEFIYKVINAYGGPDLFYKRYYINAVCPLGFIKRKNKKFVNYNYYDDRELLLSIKDFIINCIKMQMEFNINSEICFCLGMDKNFKYLTALNDEFKFFKTIVPLSHPRFVMQYRRKSVDVHVKEYLDAFKKAEKSCL